MTEASERHESQAALLKATRTMDRLGGAASFADGLSTSNKSDERARLLGELTAAAAILERETGTLQGLLALHSPALHAIAEQRALVEQSEAHVAELLSKAEALRVREENEKRNAGTRLFGAPVRDVPDDYARQFARGLEAGKRAAQPESAEDAYAKMRAEDREASHRVG